MKNWKTISTVFEPGRTRLQPFAGLYPTRWRIAMTYALGQRARTPNQAFEYLGKPNPTVAARLRYILRHATTGRIFALEFDAGGALGYASCVLPRFDGSLIVSDWNSCFRFYYPWLTGDAEMLTTWIGRTMHRIPIVYQGRSLLIYADHRLEDIAPANWQGHKTWLNANAIQLAKTR